jgi:3'(2'), 5'-bisphosphate nucleotidase
MRFTETPETAVALHAVRMASLLARRVQSELVSPALTKDDRSPVTVADFASQALVAKLLADKFPGDPLVAEEDSSALRNEPGEATLQQVTQFVQGILSQADPRTVCSWIDRGRADPAARFWTLDPVDGTKGFLRGEQYAVALALVVDGQVQIGALGCPNLVDAYRPDQEGDGSLLLAVRGQGAWVTPLTGGGDFERLHVSNRSDPRQARLLRSVESGHTNVDKIDEFAQSIGVEAEPVLMDSQAKYAVLAAGKGDIILRLLSPSRPNYREKVWDQAAGSLVLEEAGGQISDLDGKAFDFMAGRSLVRNRGVLASNGRLHCAALEALKRIGA